MSYNFNNQAYSNHQSSYRSDTLSQSNHSDLSNCVSPIEAKPLGFK